jgi:hypothetical protein
MSTEPTSDQGAPTGPRCCPFCGSIRIVRRGQVPDGAWLTKVEQWCAECEREFFWFISTSGPIGDHLPPELPRT